MKSFALATAALFALVAAKPLPTVTEIETVQACEPVIMMLDTSTSTLITPGQSAPTNLTPIPGPTDGQFFEAPSAPPSAPKQTPVAALTSSSAPPPPPAASTTTAAPPPPPPPPPPAAPAASAPGSSSAVAIPSGNFVEGIMTYYDVGMGSCGFDDTGKDNTECILAVPHGVMGSASNSNPMCNKAAVISANGKSVDCVIRDKCMGCDTNHIDVSRKCFEALNYTLEAGKVKVQFKLPTV